MKKTLKILASLVIIFFLWLAILPNTTAFACNSNSECGACEFCTGTGGVCSPYTNGCPVGGPTPTPAPVGSCGTGLYGTPMNDPHTQCNGTQDPTTGAYGWQCVSVSGCGDNSCGSSADCAATYCPAPGPIGGTCGNGICTSGVETCSSCPSDCGACPPTPTPPPSSFSVSGNVFIDTNGNRRKDGGEANYSGSVTVTSSGGGTRSSSGGSYTISGIPDGNTTISLTLPSGYSQAYPPPGNPNSFTVNVGGNCTVGGSNSATCSGGSSGSISNLNFGIVVTTFTVSGNVFVDTNRNGRKDGSEANASGRTVTCSGTGGSTQTTSGSGNYTCTGLASGSHNVTLTVPSGNTATTTNPRTITVGPDATVNFGYAPVYTVSGSVFVDASGDGRKNNSEINYMAGSITIRSLNSSGASSGSVTYPTPPPNSGNFQVSNLVAGNYRIQYANLPQGYIITAPTSGAVPPTWNVTVGSGCQVGGSSNASCAANSIQNLNFGINNLQPWIQSTGGNIRIDAGIDNKIPSNADPLCGGAFMSLAGNGGEPGIIYSGASSASFGNGQASSTNWVVSQPDGQVYNPPTPNTIRTAYGYIAANAGQQGLTINDIAPYCSGGITNCSLSASIPTGIYRSSGNLTLTGNYTFPASRNFIILVNGNLTLLGEVHVPAGSTAVFSASQDVLVGRGVGEVLNTSSRANLEGIYSSDRDFIVQGDNNCSVGPDRRLNISGSVISNASLAGGSFTVQRNLCLGNTCPSVSIVQRLDLIINLPPILRTPHYIWKEVAP